MNSVYDQIDEQKLSEITSAQVGKGGADLQTSKMEVTLHIFVLLIFICGPTMIGT